MDLLTELLFDAGNFIVVIIDFNHEHTLRTGVNAAMMLADIAFIGIDGDVIFTRTVHITVICDHALSPIISYKLLFCLLFFVKHFCKQSSAESACNLSIEIRLESG